MLETSRWVLWGSTGQAKVLASLIRLRGGTVVALFDNDPNAQSVLPGVPLFIGCDGFTNWYATAGDPHQYCALAAIGGSRGYDRVMIQSLFSEYGLRVDSLIHPQATVCSTARLGAGCQILAQAIVAADSELGDACIINHHASVDHDCMLGKGVHLAPQASLCGCIFLGDNVMIGANATVLPRLHIGDNTIVGAGAVVTSDLPASVVAAGNPARVVKDI